MIDGASPFRVLRSIIVPLSVPAIVGRQPVPLLLRLERLLPAAALSRRASPTSSRCPSGSSSTTPCTPHQPTLIQATALMTMAVPVVVFFLTQRAFMRGVVVTGVDK